MQNIQNVVPEPRTGGARVDISLDDLMTIDRWIGALIEKRDAAQDELARVQAALDQAQQDAAAAFEAKAEAETLLDVQAPDGDEPSVLQQLVEGFDESGEVGGTVTFPKQTPDRIPRAGSCDRFHGAEECMPGLNHPGDPL